MIVLTGFLGAGKTTLLKRFLGTPEGADTAVVVNEFGAVGIDDQLLRASSEETVLIGNGCLCCITRTDLQLTLRRLLIERERGEIPHFRQVVIETSGLADPGPLLATFATDRALGGEYAVEAVLAVVDAVNGLATLEWSAEARKQVILADLLIVTKTDLAESAATTRLRERLAQLNPRATVEIAVDGHLAPRCFIDPSDPADRSQSRGFVAEAEHSDDIASFVLREDVPTAWPVFTQAMETLMALRGDDLLRVKGLLAIAGCRGPVVVQVVQHLAHPPVELAAWPSPDRSSRLVFIARNVPERAVRDLFRAVGALGPAPTSPRHPEAPAL